MTASRLTIAAANRCACLRSPSAQRQTRRRSEFRCVALLGHYGTEVLNDKFCCAWTLCSTRSGCGWPQRSQLQPRVPSLACCVTLLPATFWNLGLGDPLSSCNKGIGFISYSFFAWQIRIRRDRKTSRGLGFALRKSLRPKPNRDHLELPPRRNRCRTCRARRSFGRSFHHRLVPEGCGKIKNRRP